jgi:hypothetical protein
MKIEITSRHTPEGKEYYEWSLWDGPADCSDHARGYASDLIVAFSKLIEWRERIVADYASEVLKDLDTLNTFLSNNETDTEPTD